MATLALLDETATGGRLAESTLTGLPDRMTVRELVRLRVREEVARHNAAPSRHFTGLVRPDDAEAEANGYRLREARRLDWERQADIAERAFAHNGFIVLAGDRQVESLEEVVDLEVHTELVFIKLVQLVGG
ncbi:hypothetical protein GCM10027176_06650 [Actinoallomurus bryophytorum]|uniref:Uncharacterized protein n=1 Tax=Actinoallomurus bryophytorum TaxID=1490222 RepID=A0A543CP19_9ACTN|nr:hypothetical protein [Actinoallomurus bryophytorum]TQL98846.1 hypothetical protein FB559_4480 [Actinoallomurus bryophytorum]